jgi:hypothetical protein
MLHSWEDPPAVPVAEPHRSFHSWESDSANSAGGGGGPSDGDSSDSDLGDTSDPGRDLVDFAMCLYMERALSAAQFCVLMHLCSKCGVEQATPLSFRPGAPTGHYQRHLNSVLEVLSDRTPLYDLTVPSYSSEELCRSEYTMPVVPLHECVDELYSSSSTLRVKLKEKIENRELPRAYYEHKLVREHPEHTWYPITLFLDAVPYSDVDSVVGFWLVCMITGVRKLFCVLRKKILCVCGCRGWCSNRCVFAFLRWSLEALAIGEFPKCRHDFSSWLPSDASRRDKAGTPLSDRACLVYIKGD